MNGLKHWIRITLLPWLGLLAGFQFTKTDFQFESEPPPLIVVIDPGHDPSSPGAISARGKLEVDYNDGLAERLLNQLKSDSRLRPVLSRLPGQVLSLTQRLARIRSLNPDLVISLHHDSVQPHLLTSWQFNHQALRYCDRYAGFSIFVPAHGHYAGISQLAAEMVADALLQTQRRPSEYHALPIPHESRTWIEKARGIYAGDFLFLLRENDLPQLLLELGFVVNRSEELQFQDPKFVEAQARAIAEGVQNYAKMISRHRTQSPPGPTVGDEALDFPDLVPTNPVIRFIETQPGLEVSLLPIYFHQKFVERLVLVRADPERFKLEVHHDATEPKTIVEWQQALGATVVINSSYYGMDLEPATPILLDGKIKGPTGWFSKHGAFLAEPRDEKLPRFAMKDFHGEKVDLPSLGYKQAVVSYPTLLDFSGKVRAAPNPRWRADRSFIAIDRQKRIVLGTTHGGFFSLNRLGHYLKALPGLDLDYALNLDGGPPACMAVSTDSFKTVVWGRYESNDSTGIEVIFWGSLPVFFKIPAVISLSPRSSD